MVVDEDADADEGGDDTGSAGDDTGGVDGDEPADDPGASDGTSDIEAGGSLKGECGCATSASPSRYLWMLPLVGLMVRRRYQ